MLNQEKIMDLHRIGIKFYSAKGDDVPLTDFIPVFHKWIQEGKLEDVMIDVAEYSHVPAGPGTMLIAYEGNYAVDETGDKRGFLYYSKQPMQETTLAERLAAVCRKNLAACKLLEEAEETRDRINFNYGELQVFSNDRLAAPNTDEAWQIFEPALKSFLDRLYPATEYSIVRGDNDPRERLSAFVVFENGTDKANELLHRLGA